MGFFDWMMKGVTAVEEDTTSPAVSQEELEKLANLSKIEKENVVSNQEMPFNSQPNNNVINNTINQTLNQSPQMQAFNNQYVQNPAYNNAFLQNAMQPNVNNANYMDIRNTQTRQTTVAKVVSYKIFSKEDIKYLLRALGRGEICTAEFVKMPKKTFNLLFAFLEGGVFGLSGKCEKWTEGTYMITPMNTEAIKQERAKKKR